MDFGFTGKKFHEDASEPQRVVTEFFPHPLLSGRRRISLVEDQVDHREYGLKPARNSSPRGISNGTWASERVLLARKIRWPRVFSGTRKARAISAVVRPPDQTQRESDAPFNREDWMAGGKDEAEDVIIDDLVQSLVQCFSEPLLLEFKLARNLSVLLFEHPATAQRVDCAPLCRCHQPGRRLFRNAFFRPLLKGRDESVLSEFFRNADVAGNAGNPGDEACGLDLPHGLNRPL